MWKPDLTCTARQRRADRSCATDALNESVLASQATALRGHLARWIIRRMRIVDEQGVVRVRSGDGLDGPMAGAVADMTGAVLAGRAVAVRRGVDSGPGRG